MYDYFTGEIVDRQQSSIVLDVSGVGYRLTVSRKCAETLPASGRIRLYAHLHVREDEHRLYGFQSAAERMVFEALLGVGGVGPSLALQVCSHFAPIELRRAVLAEDVRRLSSAKGIGNKTARRIVLDLKAALAKMPESIFVAGGPSDDAAAGDVSIPDVGPIDEAIRALVALGYSEAAAEGALRKVVREAGADELRAVETLVRLALRASRRGGAVPPAGLG